MLFQQIIEPKLSHYAYLIGCQQTRQAVIVDPQRDIDRYIEIAAAHNTRIVAALDTHIHADYLSGLREFADKCGTKILVSGEGGSEWRYNWLWGSAYDYRLLKDGEVFEMGTVRLQALHTPGHTPEHLSFLVCDRTVDETTTMGILTGDFVFVGDVGRPDLLESAAGQTGSMIPAARQLFNSLTLFKDLPQFLQLWPAHGAGSACGKALGAIPVSTVGYELRCNRSIKASENQDRFVRFILDGQPEPPPYFARMKKANRDGPEVLAGIPEPRELELHEMNALEDRAGGALIDTRSWEEYIAGHLKGSLSIVLNKAFPAAAGSFVDPARPIYLLVERGRVREAVLDLTRIGLDRIHGFVTRETFLRHVEGGGALVTTTQIDVERMKRRMHSDHAFLLDVRGGAEFAAGHVRGACNIAHTRLTSRLSELPNDRQILVICQAGERSGYAVSYLETAGYDAVHIRGGFSAWRDAGEAVCVDPSCQAGI